MLRRTVLTLPLLGYATRFMSIHETRFLQLSRSISSGHEQPSSAQFVRHLSTRSLSIVQDAKNSRRKKRYYAVEGSAQTGFQLTKREEGGPTWNTSESKSILEYGSRRITSFLRATFLPSGYPNTVGPGYLPFVAWQSVANFCVAANAVISSTFLLYSVGLGAGAIATAGAMNWVLKDGLGQMGTLLFGKAIAHNFDIHSKSWFFLSMVKLNIATGLEIMTILVPQYFLFLGSLANSLKGLAFMANGSTRSVFNLSFARDNNIADITAKGTSQFICASMFGTVAGASLCGLVGQDTRLALGCYSLLAFCTMWSAFATVKSIPLPTLNNTRLQLLCEAYLTAISSSAASRASKRGAHIHRPQAPGPPSLSLDWRDFKTADDMAGWEEYERGGAHAQGSCNSNQGGWGAAGSLGSCSELERSYDEYWLPELPSPEALAAEDPPLPWLMGDVRILNPAIIVGRPLDKLLEKGGGALLAVLLSTFKHSRYLMMPCGSALNVVLHHEAKPRDICQAYLQACLLRRRMRQDPSLGQAAALHECAVKRMKSSQAAEAAADPATAAGDREHGRTSTIAGVCSPRSSSGPDDSRGGVARSWEDAPAQRGAGGGHGGGNSDCASEQRRNDSGDNFDYNDAERLGQEFGSNEASSSQGGSKSMGMSSNECWGERVTASPTRFSHECSTSISSTSTISSSTSTTSTSCSDGGSSGNKNNCGISSDVRDGSGKADTAECLPDPSGAGAPLAVSLGDKEGGVEVTWQEARGTVGAPCWHADPQFWVTNSGASSTSLAELRIALQDTLQTAERLTTPFMAALESSGWQLGKIVVEGNRRRARW